MPSCITADCLTICSDVTGIRKKLNKVELWRKNLLVCWFTMFVTMVGYSQIAPVLPLFVKQLGVTNVASVERISGIAYGVTYIISAFFAPLWGYAADKIGRKPMLLRATAGIAVLTFCVGFARSVTALITLRALQGTVTGVGTACTTLIATQTDKDHEAMDADKKVICVGEDMSKKGGSWGYFAGPKYKLAEEFGEDRILDMPIAESGYSAMSVGMEALHDVHKSSVHKL